MADSICLRFFCVTSFRSFPRGPTRTYQIVKCWLTFKREFNREMMFVGKTHKTSFFSVLPTIFLSGWNEGFLRPVVNAFTCSFILYQNFNSLPQKINESRQKIFSTITKRFYFLFTSNFVLPIFHFFLQTEKIGAKSWGKKQNFVFSKRTKKYNIFVLGGVKCFNPSDRYWMLLLSYLFSTKILTPFLKNYYRIKTKDFYF